MYSSITIIFNPNSTGDAPEMARELCDDLRKAFPKISVELNETKRAGHAEELAYKAAQNGKHPLIISVSGDGGYHEVINGAMKAVEQGATPICAVHAAGNANDHRRMIRKRPLIESIKAKDISQLDLLHVKWNRKSRYAHSYVGFGLTPVVAVELNRHTLNSLMEAFIILKTYWNLRPFDIEIQGKKTSMDSLVLANISEMAKVLKLSKDGKPNDRKFEVIKVNHRSKFKLALWALKAATIGLGKQPQTDNFEFTTIKPMPMQLDGEVLKVDPSTKLQISIADKSIETIR